MTELPYTIFLYDPKTLQLKNHDYNVVSQDLDAVKNANDMEKELRKYIPFGYSHRINYVVGLYQSTQDYIITVWRSTRQPTKSDFSFRFSLNDYKTSFYHTGESFGSNICDDVLAHYKVKYFYDKNRCSFIIRDATMGFGRLFNNEINSVATRVYEYLTDNLNPKYHVSIDLINKKCHIKVWDSTNALHLSEDKVRVIFEHTFTKEDVLYGNYSMGAGFAKFKTNSVKLSFMDFLAQKILHFYEDEVPVARGYVYANLTGFVSKDDHFWLNDEDVQAVGNYLFSTGKAYLKNCVFSLAANGINSSDMYYTVEVEVVFDKTEAGKYHPARIAVGFTHAEFVERRSNRTFDRYFLNIILVEFQKKYIPDTVFKRLGEIDSLMSVLQKLK